VEAIYDLTRADYEIYAEAYVDESSYLKRPDCARCDAQRWDRVSPLVIEWEAGSDEIADFTFMCVLEEIMVTQRVREFMEENAFTGVGFGPVAMVQNPRLRRPMRPNARSKKRIWLPYGGPTLWELKITSSCHLNLKRSKWALLSECPVCHQQDFDVDRKRPMKKSFFVHAESWDGSDFFRIAECGLIFVSGRAAKAMAKAKFSNLEIAKRGAIGS
jgi:hypothetical protein